MNCKLCKSKLKKENKYSKSYHCAKCFSLSNPHFFIRTSKDKSFFLDYKNKILNINMYFNTDGKSFIYDLKANKYHYFSNEDLVLNQGKEKFIKSIELFLLFR